MKRVIIIGGGPVGLTLANELSKTLNVTVITPKRPFRFLSTRESEFKLNENSTSGGLFGNSKLWGSQHEGLGNKVESKPVFSDLPGFPFDLNELNKFDKELLRQGWPKLTSQRLFYSNILKVLHHNVYWKGKSLQPLPKFLNSKIDFIVADFQRIDFNINKDFKVESIKVDQTKFSADIFCLAAGGLSNVALLQKLKEGASSQEIFHLNMLGAGYSNHPKSTFAIIKFDRPKYFGFAPKFNTFKRMNNWDLCDDSPEPRPLRVSTRLWPIYDNSNWKRAIASRLLRVFGYYTKARWVVYVELPQISQNFVRFEKQQKNELYFYFNYHFPMEMEDYLQSKLDQIVERVSRNPKVTIMEREQVSLRKMISQDANHHFGGTRMAANPENGVVDSYLKCFGISNLYILGTSTLPVSSFLHPTLLSAALALRAAEQITNNV